jgi:hypothetical protein
MRVFPSTASRGVGMAALCLVASIQWVPSVQGGEPVVVLNGPTSVGEKSEAVAKDDARPVVKELIAQQPTAPHANWPVTPAAALVQSPLPEIALQSEPAAAPRSAPAIEAAKSDVFAGSKGEATHSGSGRVKVTRYNRNSVLARGDNEGERVPARPAADPSISTIECVAGCGGKSGMVVYRAPVVSTTTGKPLSNIGVQTVASAMPTAAEAATIQCVAGCYSTPKAYPSRAAPGPMQQATLSVPPASAQPTVVSLGRSMPSAAAMVVPKPAVARKRPQRPSVQRAQAKRTPTPWRTWSTQVTLHNYLAPRARPAGE